jgi:hypothetical protein
VKNNFHFDMNFAAGQTIIPSALSALKSLVAAVSAPIHTLYFLSGPFLAKYDLSIAQLT